MFKYNCGSHLGNAVFIWKIGDKLDLTKQSETLVMTRKLVPTFEKESLAREMRKKYEKIANITPVVRRSLVEFLTGKIPRYVYLIFTMTDHWTMTRKTKLLKIDKPQYVIHNTNNI